MATVKMVTSNPCYNCSDRDIGCHSRCDRYKATYAENEARKAAIREKAALDTIVYQMNVEASKKRKRRKNL